MDALCGIRLIKKGGGKIQKRLTIFMLGEPYNIMLCDNIFSSQMIDLDIQYNQHVNKRINECDRVT